MSETFRCDDKETLVAFLYGEIDADGRREVERHLRTCAACAEEIEGLQAVRRDLEAWMPPVPESGFTIVQKPAPVLRPSRWASASTMPAWAQVAAAALVIGVGAAIANLQVRYGNDGVVVSTGWMTPAPSARAGAGAVATRPSEEWKPALVALEQQLRAELSADEADRRSRVSDAASRRRRRRTTPRFCAACRRCSRRARSGSAQEVASRMFR